MQRLFSIFRSVLTRKPEILIKIFNAYVRPILEYASPLFNETSKKDTKKLERPQRLFTRILFRRIQIQNMQRDGDPNYCSSLTKKWWKKDDDYDSHDQAGAATKTLVLTGAKSMNSAVKAVDAAAKAGKAAGPAAAKTGATLVKTKYLLPVAAVVDVYRLGSAAQNGKFVKTAAKIGGEWSGGWAGATAGAAIGSAIFPVGGTIIGGIAGSLIGALTGGWATEKVAEALD